MQSARCPVAVLVTDAASQSSSSEKGANAALGTNCGLHKVRGALAARPVLCLLCCAGLTPHRVSAPDRRRSACHGAGCTWLHPHRCQGAEVVLRTSSISFFGCTTHTDQAQRDVGDHPEAGCTACTARNAQNSGAACTFMPPGALLQDLLEAIDSAGAQHISFNPLTKLNIEKTLNRIAAAEGVVLPKDAASILAEAANGDLQHATESLQWLSVGKRGCPPLKGGQKKVSKCCLDARCSTVCRRRAMAATHSSVPGGPCWLRQTGVHHAISSMMCRAWSAWIR